jgi:hypothetical protein
MANTYRTYDHLRVPTGSYSSAVRNRNWLFIAGTTVGAGANTKDDYGDIGEQAETVFRYIGAFSRPRVGATGTSRRSRSS